MSMHIGAQIDEVATKVLLPGDPLRAKFIAENFLDDAVCYSEIRGMYGFTGSYKGKRVSVQGTGMGMPSASIYIHELIESYGVKSLIRVGTCGAMQKGIKLRDLIIPMAACTNSNMNKSLFGNLDFAPTADFELLREAYERAISLDGKVHVGSILTNDSFYSGSNDTREILKGYNVLAEDMETAALYTIAAGKRARALSLLTVSDSMVTDEAASAEDRQSSFIRMVEVALDII